MAKFWACFGRASSMTALAREHSVGMVPQSGHSRIPAWRRPIAYGLYCEFTLSAISRLIDFKLGYSKLQVKLRCEIEEIGSVHIEILLRLHVLLRRIAELERPLHECGAQARRLSRAQIVFVRRHHHHLVRLESKHGRRSLIGFGIGLVMMEQFGRE